MEGPDVISIGNASPLKGAAMTLPSLSEYIEVPLSRGQVALIDSSDSNLILPHKWHVVWSPCTSSFYAETWLYSPRKLRETMHRIIMGCRKRDGQQVDHINGNTLDNRRSNLRLVNHSQNMMNRKLESIGSGGYRGVSLCKQTGRWKARLVVDGRELWLGRFSSKESAIIAVREARAVHYGEYARRD